jgi:hypothetical protein
MPKHEFVSIGFVVIADLVIIANMLMVSMNCNLWRAILTTRRQCVAILRMGSAIHTIAAMLTDLKNSDPNHKNKTKQNKTKNNIYYVNYKFIRIHICKYLLRYNNQMNFNATPVGNLPNMPPQQNDPNLMSQIMRDAHMDHQRPNVQVPHVQPSYQPPPPVLMEQQKSNDSFIPEFDIAMILEKLKEPIIVAVIFFLLGTDAVQNLLQQNLPMIFLGEDVMKQMLVKAGIAGVGFFILKHTLNKQ